MRPQQLYRKLNRQRSVFPNETALLKALYLSTFEDSANPSMKKAANPDHQFVIFFLQSSRSIKKYLIEKPNSIRSRFTDIELLDAYSRTPVPFAQWSFKSLGAGLVLPFAPTNSGRFRLCRTAHWADASFVCLSNASHCHRSGVRRPDTHKNMAGR